MTVFEPHDEMKKCIISFENQRAIYEYEKLIEYFTNSFLESSISTESDALNDAIEWVDYNVLRSIPYMGENAPIIVSKVEYDEEEDDAQDFIYIDSIKYLVII